MPALPVTATEETTTAVRTALGLSEAECEVVQMKTPVRSGREFSRVVDFVPESGLTKRIDIPDSVWDDGDAAIITWLGTL